MFGTCLNHLKLNAKSLGHTTTPRLLWVPILADASLTYRRVYCVCIADALPIVVRIAAPGRSTSTELCAESTSSFWCHRVDLTRFSLPQTDLKAKVCQNQYTASALAALYTGSNHIFIVSIVTYTYKYNVDSYNGTMSSTISV